MSDNKEINDFNVYKRDYLENIKEGRYKIYNAEDPEKYSTSKSWYILISDTIYKYYRYYIYNDSIHDCLNKNNIKLEKLEIIDKIITYDKIYEDMFIYKINEPSIYNNYLICNKINDNVKEFFIEQEKNEEIYKYPVYNEIYDNGIGFPPKIHYNIKEFYLNTCGINSIKSSTFYTGNKYNYPSYDYTILIHKKIRNILQTYFKCENDKIYCIYNNKKEIAKLTFITEDIIKTDDNNNILLQSLRLEIGEKKFTFYINNPKLINYNKEGKYCFLVIHVRSGSSLISNNLIVGYEFNKDEYYYLKYEERLILKNIDNEIAGKYINMKKQDLYTYLLSNNERCGMTINIDKDHNVTYKLVKLNDKCFEKLIDISLLTPVSEWNKELYEINNINNKNEFDGIVEGFDN